MPIIRREIHEQETTPEGNIVDRTIYEYEYFEEEIDYIYNSDDSEDEEEEEQEQEQRNETEEIEECAGTTCENKECCPN